MSKSTFVYVTFIRTSVGKLWQALTTPEFQREYWFGVHCESEWKKGSSWKMVYPDGRITDQGEIVEIDPPRRVVIKWQNEWNPEYKAEGYSYCTYELEQVPDLTAVKLTITHTIDKPASKLIEGVSGGWPRILSNLKSLIETGEVLLGKTKVLPKV